MKPSSLALRINFITIIAVYLLILIGGIVRSLGAGMGCPDWPKCFGAYLPPSSLELLPENYQEIYTQKRREKNERLSSVLDILGMQDLSIKLKSDPAVNKETYFDVDKAWTEYVNRLFGVAIGFLIILNMIYSFKYWKINRSISLLGIISLILVLFQGWIGSLVVSTNLIPGFISFHMILAILMVILLTVQYHKMTNNQLELIWGKKLLFPLFILFLIQIVLGIQVREQMDFFQSADTFDRSEWISNAGLIFMIHRSYSIILLLTTGLLYYKNLKIDQNRKWLDMFIGVIILEIIIGVLLSYLGMPALVQPFHLLFGTMAVGILFYLILLSNVKFRLA